VVAIVFLAYFRAIRLVFVLFGCFFLHLFKFLVRISTRVREKISMRSSLKLNCIRFVLININN
jgi:hypothetical protein